MLKLRLPFYEHQKKNWRIEVALWLIFVLIFALIGAAISAFFQLSALMVKTGNVSLRSVIFVSLCSGIFGLLWMLLNYYLTTPFLLKKLHARPINLADDKETMLKNIAEELSVAAGIRTPKLSIIDDFTWLNSFASGRSESEASICVTCGLLRIMNRDELQGVLGHEISHIKSQDIRAKFAYLAATELLADLVNRIRMVHMAMWDREVDTDLEADLKFFYAILALITLVPGIILYFASFFAKLISLLIGRGQEFLADVGSVQFTRNPNALASALKKIRDKHKPHHNISFAEAPLFIANPRNPGFFDRLVSTHPSIDERIRRLESMGADIEFMSEEIKILESGKQS